MFYCYYYLFMYTCNELVVGNEWLSNEKKVMDCKEKKKNQFWG